MTNNDSVVEQIVRSLSFEVIAVPTQEVIQSSTSKSTPLNVKIKVKKKADGGLEHGIIATPTLGPDGVPQRVRLMSSDHTIMSFNVVMEDADFVKPVSPLKPVIPKLPIHDGTLNPTSNQTYKADMKESKTSQSDDALKNTFTLSKVKDDETLKTSPKVQKKDIFGKCKPGGCLDPPFGEDKYCYEPPQESSPKQENCNKSKPITSSLCDKLFKKKTKPDKSNAKPDKPDCILSPSQSYSCESPTLSNSLITYPSPLDESDIRLPPEKPKIPTKNHDSISKKSNDNSGSLYIIPKKNKNSAELKDPLHEKEKKPCPNLINLPPVVVPPIQVNIKPLQPIVSTDPDSHKESESKNNLIETDQNAKNENDELDNTKQIQSNKDISDTNGTNEDTSLKNLFPEIPPECNDGIDDIMSSGDLSIVIAEKEKSEKPAGVGDEKIEEKQPSSNTLIQNKEEDSVPISEESDRDPITKECKSEKDQTEKSARVDDETFEEKQPSSNTLIQNKEEHKVPISKESDIRDPITKPCKSKKENTEKPALIKTVDDNVENLDLTGDANESNIDTDILPVKTSRPKCIKKIDKKIKDKGPCKIKDKGPGIEVIYEDMDGQDKIKPLPESDQLVDGNTKSDDSKTSTLNSNATVNIDLERNWKDGKETIDFNITIENNGTLAHDGKCYENVVETAEESDEKRPEKPVTVGDEIVNETQPESDVQNIKESSAPISTESNVRDPCSKESTIIKGVDKTTQEQTQESSSKNILEPILDGDDENKIDSDVKGDTTKSDSNYLNEDTSSKGQSKTDLKNIVDSIPTDEVNVCNDYHENEMSDTDANKQADNVRKEKNDDKQIVAKPTMVEEGTPKRPKNNVSFDNEVLDMPEVREIKTTAEKPIKIDLGLHCYNTDDEVIIKSFDTKKVLERHPKDAIIITSCNLRDPFEMKVPIDDDNLLLIQIKNNSNYESDTKANQPSVLSKYCDRIGVNKNAEISKLTEVYEKIFENELVPLQDTIKRLKQDVDILIYQQTTLKENLLSKRVKQMKAVQGNKRCCCSRK